MSKQYGTEGSEKQAQAESQQWAEQLEMYLSPVSTRLDAYLDRRVVGNLTATVAGIVQTRSALTTSELGSAICGPDHGEAGTQRLQRALHHQGWEAKLIEEVLWEQAEMSRQQIEERGETPLCIWDSSVLEKPESEKLEGLGAVRSSRVRRLARSRKGLFNRPAAMPVSVRGFEWESLLLVGQSGVPHVVAMKQIFDRLFTAKTLAQKGAQWFMQGIPGVFSHFCEHGVASFYIVQAQQHGADNAGPLFRWAMLASARSRGAIWCQNKHLLTRREKANQRGH